MPTLLFMAAETSSGLPNWIEVGGIPGILCLAVAALWRVFTSQIRETNTRLVEQRAFHEEQHRKCEQKYDDANRHIISLTEKVGALDERSKQNDAIAELGQKMLSLVASLKDDK